MDDYAGQSSADAPTSFPGDIDQAPDYAGQSRADAPTSFPGDTDPQPRPPDSMHPEWTPPTAQETAVNDAKSSAIWDTLGVIPIVGTISSAVATGVDLVKAGVSGIDGDSSGATRDLRDAELDAMGAIPIAGQILSGEALVADVHALDQREQGGSAADAPTFGDMWAEGQKDILPNPFSDPDAWTPTAPSTE